MLTSWNDSTPKTGITELSSHVVMEEWGKVDY